MTQKLWFKRRSYGWGWTPITWQGWLAITIFLLLFAVPIVLLTTNNAWWITFCGLILFLNGMVMMIICFKKGEIPRWQWGNKPLNHD